MSIKKNYDFNIKTIVIGDPGVGKSALVNRLNFGSFSYFYEITIGVDFSTIFYNHNGKILKFSVWDTAGQDRFNSLISNYYKNSMLVILCFDLSNYNSLLNLDKWINEAKKNINNSVEPVYIVVGTKKDMDHNYDKVKKTLDIFCEKYDIQNFLVSSKDENAVELKDKIFGKISDKLIKNYIDIEKDKQNYIIIEKNNECCNIL